MNSFQILLNYFKKGDNDDDFEDIPALDKLPTNQFIESFLDIGEEEDDDPQIINNITENVKSQTGISLVSESRDTLASSQRKRSGATRSATLSASRQRQKQDDDTETVLDVREEIQPYDDTGQRAYRNACAKYQSLPIDKFHRQLNSGTTIDMKHYCSGPEAAKAFAVPLVINSQITSLNLKGNGLTADGLSYIVKMMVENDFITQLNLADNNLKSEGAKLVVEMLHTNHNIEVLDLSGNGFTDNDATILCKAIEEHATLKVVNLGSNEFGEPSGKALKSMIGESDTIHDLDLSWNHIRGKAAIEIAKGLKENVGLRTLNLAWNGFGDAGAAHIAAALKVCTLTELDLTNNRIGELGMLALGKAIKTNDDLKVLKLGKNPIPEITLRKDTFEQFKKMDELYLESLDLSDVLFSGSFQAAVDEVKALHPKFSCPFGYTDSYGKRKLAGYSSVGEAMREMFKYCDEHNISIVELFARFDDDGSMSVSHEEFRIGLKEARIPVSDVQIQELIDTFDQDGDGEIDFSEMVLGAEKYK